MVEVHPHPDEALSDAEQQLTLDQFRDMMAALVPVHEQVRALHGDLLPATALASAARRAWRGIEPTRSVARPRPSVATRPTCAARLRGELRLPGDKSISHRALMLAALAAGESRIEGAGDGADVRSTAGIVARARGRRSSASPRTAGPSPTGSSRPAPTACASPSGDPRLRQLRDEPAADRRDARRAADDRASSTATLRCAAVRSLVSSSHCARWARCSTPDGTTPSLP